MDLFLFFVGGLGALVGFILLIINVFRKKPKKNALIILGVSIVLFIVSLEMTPNNDSNIEETEEISTESNLTEEDLIILDKDFSDLNQEEKTRLITMRSDMTVEEMEKYKKDLKRLHNEEMSEAYNSNETTDKIFEERFEYDIRKKNNELTEEELKKLEEEKAAEKKESNKTDEKDSPKEDSNPTPIVENTTETREDSIGKSSKDFIEITKSKPSEVREDVTGKWRKITTSTSEDLIEYILSYNKLYMTKNTTVHSIINFTKNTTIIMNDFGSYVSVRIHEYVDKEEHDANKLGTGMLLTEYQIYKDNGDIIKVE